MIPASILTVTDAADDLTLLTAAELRVAAGLDAADASRDATLAVLGTQAAAAITAACDVGKSGARLPTLRLESLSELFRLEGQWRWLADTDARQPVALVLARRPVVTLTAVTEDDTLLDATDYEVEPASGLLYRLRSDRRVSWRASKVVAVYDAGWATVPGDLKRAAGQLVQLWLAEGSRDPLLRGVTVDGVGRRDYWVGSATDPALPSDVIDLLDRGGYRNHSAG